MAAVNCEDWRRVWGLGGAHETAFRSEHPYSFKALENSAWGERSEPRHGLSETPSASQANAATGSNTPTSVNIR